MSKNNEAVAAMAPAPPKFSIERLRADCHALFGITPSTFDGAVYGLTGEYTFSALCLGH